MGDFGELRGVLSLLRLVRLSKCDSIQLWVGRRGGVPKWRVLGFGTMYVGLEYCMVSYDKQASWPTNLKK